MLLTFQLQFYRSDSVSWHFFLEATHVAGGSSPVVQHCSQQKLKLGNILFNRCNLHVNFISAFRFSLTCFFPVNRTLSVVLLFCAAPSPGLHTHLYPFWPSRQAHEASVAAHSGLHSHLLTAAPQRVALYHVHFSSSQLGGCSRLLFHVGWMILMCLPMFVYKGCKACKHF